MKWYDWERMTLSTSGDTIVWVMARFAGEDDQRALEVARKVVRTKPGFIRGAGSRQDAPSLEKFSPFGRRASFGNRRRLAALPIGGVTDVA